MSRIKAVLLATSIAAVLAGLAATSAAAKTYEVTKTGDGPLAACRSECTLRNAVRAANGNVGPDRIVLRAKKYKLTRPGYQEDLAAGGDLDVSDSVSIIGVTAKQTTILGAFASSPNRDGLITALSGFDPNLTLKNVTLSHGHTLDSGAAVQFQSSGRLRASGVRFISNSGSYAAVDNQGHDAVMDNVLFRRNVGTMCCSALYNDGPTAEIRLHDAVFDHNRATSDTGAFYSDGGKAVLDRVTFSNNRSAGVGGGAMISAGGINKLSNVTFSGNSTTGSGGGIYVESPVELNNVTFFRNVVDSDSSGSGDGGAMLVKAQATVSNSIMAGNVDRGNEGDDVCLAGAGSLNSLGHNLFGAGGCPLSVSPSDSVVGPGALGLGNLRPNGGFAPSHSLSKSSKAVGRGSPRRPGIGGGACEKKDQRGVKRPQGKRCDVGAYELKEN